MIRTFALLLVCSVFFSSALSADDYFFVIQKQEQKKSGRWNLQDWLDKRDRMRMMDLWLSMHSPTPYEFYLSGQYQTGNFKSGSYSGGYDLSFAAYAYLFGIEAKRESFTGGVATSGLFHLRLFGIHTQGTNIMLMGGVEQTERSGVQLWHPKAGATLSWYLYKAFGIEAGFHHSFFQANGTQSLAGNRWNVGALLDFSFVRIFGGYFDTSESGTLALSRKGIYLGTKVFF